MGNLHLVTGYAGQPHVSAADHATLFESTVRSGQFVTAAGSQFAAAVITNNTVRISDGELVMQGRHVKMERGAYVDLTIENGSQGSMRNDLVVARFSRNAETGIEECSLVVVKGTAAVADPSDPDYITGNINSGDHVNDLPLFRIPINGLGVDEPVRLFTPYESVFDYLKAALTGLLPLSGGTMAGAINMGGFGITNLVDPTNVQDAATKAYADRCFYPNGRYLSLPGGISDLQAFFQNGCYRLSSDPQITANGQRIDMLVHFNVNIESCVQFAFNYIGSVMQYRGCWYGTWGEWSLVTVTRGA